MQFTTKDINLLKSSYFNFLNYLRNYLLTNTNNDDVLEQFNMLSFLYKNNYFNDNQPFHFDKNEINYLSSPIELSEGIHVMTGFCCCRHVNELLNDILILLNYNPKLIYVYIDANNDWHIKQNACHSNHVIVTVITDQRNLFLDLYNNYIFTTDELGKVIMLNNSLKNEFLFSKTHFQDDNIKTISKILKKYYELRKNGITNLYDEEY